MSLRLGNAIISYTSYLFKTIWPLKLAVFYPYLADPSYFQIFSALTLLVVITLITIWQFQVRSYLCVGWFWFLVVLVPSIGFFKIGEFGMADRYTYIPIIGLFIIVTWGGAEIISRFRVGNTVPAVGVIIILSSLAFLTSQQLKHWRNSETLYRHALKVIEGNYMAHYGLGQTLASQGNFTEAVNHFQKAAQIKPEKTRILLDLGRAWAFLGNFHEARAVLQDCLAKRTDHHEARFTLGLVLALENKYEFAVRQFLTIVREIQPHDPSGSELKPPEARTLYERALQMEKNGKTEEALKTYQAVLNHQPDFFPAQDRMSQLYLNTHNYEKALAVLHIRPERKWLMKHISSGFAKWKSNLGMN